MANMGYCRFQNTLPDLQDCNDHLWNKVSAEEHRARAFMIKLCKEIAEGVGDEDWLLDPSFEKGIVTGKLQ